MVEVQLNLQTLQYLRRSFAFWARAAHCSSRNFRASSVLADVFSDVFLWAAAMWVAAGPYCVAEVWRRAETDWAARGAESCDLVCR
jgi:hypothetical protein